VNSRPSRPQTLRVVPESVSARPAGTPEQGWVGLVSAARAGDRSAWTTLVRRFDPMVRRIARAYRLSPADVDDVAQTTWMQLLEHIHRLRQPEAIAGWLCTAARRNAMRHLQTPTRERLTGDPLLGDRPDLNETPAAVLAAERTQLLHEAVASLPHRHRRLVTALLADPTLTYDELSALLGMPRGSLGPIRDRSLARLARHPRLRTVCAGDPAQ
jgi:RNA polymerase sigma factor (sigma-70 family)